MQIIVLKSLSFLRMNKIIAFQWPYKNAIQKKNNIFYSLQLCVIIELNWKGR